MDIDEEEIKIKVEEGVEVSGFFVYPKESGKYPGILLIHEIWGLNDQIRGVARRYAQEGYAVLAPHLFSRYGETLTEINIRNAMMPIFKLPQEQRRSPESLQNLMKNMNEKDRAVVKILFVERGSLMKGMAKDVKSCFDFLQNSKYCQGSKLGVTGFCMGGGLAFQVATQLPFSAAFIFYGANPDPLDAVKNIGGPVFAIYAGEDKMVDAGIPGIIQAMLDNKKTFGLKIYENQQHGFFNETSSMHDPAAAKDAWDLAVGHFNRYLKE